MLATAPTKWKPATHTQTGPNNGGGPAELATQAILIYFNGKPATVLSVVSPHRNDIGPTREACRGQ